MFLRRLGQPLLTKASEPKAALNQNAVPNARELLINLYTNTLHQIKSIPQHKAPHRDAVETFTRHRLKVCEEERDCQAIESRLGCGRVEKLIEEARYELRLIGEMIGAFAPSLTLSLVFDCLGEPFKQVQVETVSTYEAARKCNAGETDGVSLAKSLASMLDEDPVPVERISRMKLKRLIEIRVKKRVKEQHNSGKFQDLMEKVIANPETLRDAYDCIRLNSNVDLASKPDDISFEYIAEMLLRRSFDIKANTITMSTKGENKEVLVLPNLNLRIIQEAIRIVLEVVYRPHFSKISHGCRSGRGSRSALRHICKKIQTTDWWFTVNMKKKADANIVSKLFSTMEERIEDPSLYFILQSMFDAEVVNLEFGGFPKAEGLSQEGVLSPILMNIYLDLFDQEFHRLCMMYEALGSGDNANLEARKSSLRHWFRKQLKDSRNNDPYYEYSSLRIYACRFMDEILISISGSKDVSVVFKSDIQSYLINSLHMDIEETEILSTDSSHGIQFLGTLIQKRIKENPAVRAVHKLKRKVQFFASQKQDNWDAMTSRIGKKWLAHGLKKVKESEIKQLADSNSILCQISQLRKVGMETDHWYKALLKIWMQDVNAKAENSEFEVLSKNIVEPALPRELTDAFYNFQKHAEEYVSSETNTTSVLLMSSTPTKQSTTTDLLAPVSLLQKRLHRYGLISLGGYPRPTSILILQDNDEIIDWFSGLVRRWLRWYHECDNINEVKLLIMNQVRMSCIRTLAAKHRIYEAEIEKQFESDLSGIPSTQETELEMVNGMSESSVFEDDEALTYGIFHSGLCLLSLERMVSTSRPCNCFVLGCLVAAPCVYTLHVMERQKFPGWKTGFSSAVHPSLHKRRIGLCKQHVKDLYVGHISLQSIDFGAWK
ncbi:hypothetical protein Syun_009122 [Stephania yunnanensis]|uniref:Nuclear intron maturase 4, mitochondrial n=1 Tax=Stephania yunnanensis TaxID=152371 RepID=A0AAP0KFK9_9MAGN